MKIAITVQKGIYPEEYYAGMKATHKCYVVEVPDNLFPREVREVLDEMYSDDSQRNLNTITDVWLCNPKV